MADEIERISENYSEVLLKDIQEEFHKEIDEFSINLNHNMSRIRFLIDSVINGVQMYEMMTKGINKSSSFDEQIYKLELKRDLIYKDFFELQNLINAFIYQKVIMTFVSVDPQTGRRELRIFDNNVEQVQTQVVNNHNRSYTKLSYDVAEHYRILKNSLPDELNENLQNVAADVTERYVKYKGRIMWQVNNNWIGYKLSNRGPINEAFTDFYLKEVTDVDINSFMISFDPRGVIQADNANGYLIGDVSIGGLQFAVKGEYGGPQNFAVIVSWLKKIKEDNFSQRSLQEFINRFKEVEDEKATKLVKPMTKRSISAMLRYHQDDLLKSLEKYGTLT